MDVPPEDVEATVKEAATFECYGSAGEITWSYKGTTLSNDDKYRYFII